MARRTSILLTALVLAFAGIAAPAQAMQPPGEPAQDLFGCVDGVDDAVGGHPGATGLLDATPKVAELTGNDQPTAWNAVQHADPIQLGSC
jgi:hypothetical protein